jgi:hypothetical protein
MLSVTDGAAQETPPQSLFFLHADVCTCDLSRLKKNHIHSRRCTRITTRGEIPLNNRASLENNVVMNFS